MTYPSTYLRLIFSDIFSDDYWREIKVQLKCQLLLGYLGSVTDSDVIMKYCDSQAVSHSESLWS